MYALTFLNGTGALCALCGFDQIIDHKIHMHRGPVPAVRSLRSTSRNARRSGFVFEQVDFATCASKFSNITINHSHQFQT